MAYTSEEEQELNQLKEWWKENSKVVIVSLIVAFAGAFGWNYWQSYQVKQDQLRSAEYDQLIYNYQQNTENREQQLAQFIQANDKTSYAVLALLDQAKIAVENQDFASAEASLQQALAQAPEEDPLQSISALRLASVQWQLQKLDAALASLEKVKEASFANRKELLRGDILAAKGDKTAAKISYEKAQAQGSPLEVQWAKVRLNNL